MGGAEARKRREVAVLEEDDDIVGFGDKTVHFGGGGRPVLRRAMTKSLSQPSHKAWRPILLYCDGCTGPWNASMRAFRSSASMSLHKSDLGL
jgi:hypothetical protein